MPDQARPSPTMPDHARPCPTKPDQARPSPTEPDWSGMVGEPSWGGPYIQQNEGDINTLNSTK